MPLDPQTNRLSGMYTASVTPSGARAMGASWDAKSRTAWWWQLFIPISSPPSSSARGVPRMRDALWASRS